jgi:hypothetical protein
MEAYAQYTRHSSAANAHSGGEEAQNSSAQSQVLEAEAEAEAEAEEAELGNTLDMQLVRQTTRIQWKSRKALESANSAIQAIREPQSYLKAVGDAVYEKQ